MKPIGNRQPKRHYYIIHGGENVGESWAVSPKKAIVNWWWKYVKDENPMAPREYSPDDFDAVEA